MLSCMECLYGKHPASRIQSIISMVVKVKVGFHNWHDDAAYKITCFLQIVNCTIEILMCHREPLF